MKNNIKKEKMEFWNTTKLKKRTKLNILPLFGEVGWTQPHIIISFHMED
jgi:hypothetical protein